MNKQLLETVYEAFKNNPAKDKGWISIDSRELKLLTEVLGDWVPSTRKAKLEKLPQLDHPLYGLFRRSSSPLKLNSRIVLNIFKFVGHCLTTAIACYRKGPEKLKPSERDMQILLRLTMRLLEIKRGTRDSQGQMKQIICTFLHENIFLPFKNHIPDNVVKFAFNQFVLYWWAVPQKYKNRIFDIRGGLAPNLKSDFLLVAAETAKNIFNVGERTLRAHTRRRTQFTITTYHSVKGGTGKSTLAVAHALALSRECKQGEYVAILDLDILNPSLLAMRIFAETHSGFTFLEPILTSTKRPDSNDVKKAFEEHYKLNILFGSVFGPGQERDFLLKMLNTDSEDWRIVVDNLRAIIEVLMKEMHCKHVIIDNSPGFLGVEIPSAIVAAEHNGAFVLVSTLDAFDLGNIPLIQASYYNLFRHRRRVLVFNRVEDSELKLYQPAPERTLALAWQEGLRRAGLQYVVDISPRPRSIQTEIDPDYDDKDKFCLFINIDAMQKDRGYWEIYFIKRSEELATFFNIEPITPAPSHHGDPENLIKVPELELFLKSMLNKET